MKAGIDYQNISAAPPDVQFRHRDIPGFTGSQTGSAWADFLLGWPNQVQIAVTALPGIRPGEQFTRLNAWRLHSFFTDDWKVSSRLTVSLGLRWELNSPIRDIRGLTPNFDLVTGQIFPPPGTSGDLYNWNYHHFAPRVGLAWRPFGGDKTVLRASYGVFYNVNMYNNITVMTINPPFNISINQQNPPGNPVLTLANANQATSVTGTTTPEVLGVPRDYTLGNAQQWTFTAQRALPKSILLEVGYVGSKSTHFDRPAEYNLINVLAGQTQRKFTQWGDVEFIDTDASGTYEGLILKAEKRMSRGLTFLATYTFSQNIVRLFRRQRRQSVEQSLRCARGKGARRKRYPRSHHFFGSLRAAVLPRAAWARRATFGRLAGKRRLYLANRITNVPDSADRTDSRWLPSLQSAPGPARERESALRSEIVAAMVRHFGIQDRLRPLRVLGAEHPHGAGIDESRFFAVQELQYQRTEAVSVPLGDVQRHQYTLVQHARADDRHGHVRPGHQRRTRASNAVRIALRILNEHTHPLQYSEGRVLLRMKTFSIVRFCAVFACGSIAAFSQAPQAARRTPGGGIISRPVPDAASVARGQKVFVAQCGFCHGSSANGGEGGPDLIRSVLALDDENGNEIGPVILKGRPDKGMPAFNNMTQAQISDIAAFLRSRQQAAINRGAYPILNIVTGDATRGQAFFNGAGRCRDCHSPTGDFAGLGKRYDPSTLQSRFLFPSPNQGRRRGARAIRKTPTTVTVTLASGKSVSGELQYLDDFDVALRDDAGEYYSFTRDANLRVDVKDPLAAHEELLKKYTDAEMHDVLAYLVTL